MTTNIITNLLEPMCELFYKYKRDLDIYQANINTIRNYGFSTEFSLNFGFELYQPFDFNNIVLQPGVFTTNSIFTALPDITINTTFTILNHIILSDLPATGINTINYIDKTLPIIISLQSNSNSVLGIASNYATIGVPYITDESINNSIIRQFESDYTNNYDLSILIFVNIEDATFVGINTNWRSLPTSLYSTNIISYRYNNGYGQFLSTDANSAFIPNNIDVNETIYNNLYNSTYSMVYNWANNLDWVPDFNSWLVDNIYYLPTFLAQFLNDYFDLTYKQRYPFAGIWIAGSIEVPQLQLIKEAGFIGFRDDITWQTTEPSIGVYNYAQIDSRMQLATQSGLRLWAVLGYGNTNYGGFPDDSTSLEGFKNYAKALVTRYPEQGIIWEIQNEPDINWIPTNVAAYATAVNETAAAIRSISAEEWVIADGTSEIRVNTDGEVPSAFLGSSIVYGLNVDYITPHGYRHLAPNTIVHDLQQVNELLQLHSSNAKIGIGEWGYYGSWLNDPPANLVEQLQINAYVEMVNISKRYRYPLCIYNIQDSPSPTQPFGLFNSDNSIKPLFTAVKNAILYTGPGADTITTVYTYTFTPSQDTYMSAALPANNFNGLGVIQIQDSQNLLVAKKALLMFTLGALRNKTVVSAKIDTTENIGNTGNITFVRCTRTDWIDSQATWSNYKTGAPWTTAGGDSSTPSVNFVYDGLGTLTITGFEEMVQDAIDNRSNNLSIIIYTDNGLLQFIAGDFTLTIEAYTTP
jgi:hypothetical protein